METATRTPLLNTRECSEYLNVSQSFVRKCVYLRTIPHVKIGKTVRFRQADLDAWVAEAERAEAR